MEGAHGGENPIHLVAPEETKNKRKGLGVNCFLCRHAPSECLQTSDLAHLLKAPPAPSSPTLGSKPLLQELYSETLG